MTAGRRFVAFNSVGALGMMVQLATVGVLLGRCHLHYAVATGLGVAAAVLHNFFWHRYWTWSDDRWTAGGGPAAFLRFAGGNGLVSLAGNLGLVVAAVEVTGLGGVAANLVAIAGCGLLNFWIGDRLVFREAVRCSAAPAGLKAGRSDGLPNRSD